MSKSPAPCEVQIPYHTHSLITAGFGNGSEDWGHFLPAHANLCPISVVSPQLQPNYPWCWTSHPWGVARESPETTRHHLPRWQKTISFCSQVGNEPREGHLSPAG